MTRQCEARLFCAICKLFSFPDKMPCQCWLPVPSASFLPLDCCFRPWFSQKPWSELLRHALSCASLALRITWRRGSCFSLLAVAWDVCFYGWLEGSSFPPAWCCKNDAIYYTDGKPGDASLPCGYAHG